MSQVVLIVDDDPVQRRLLEAMVQRFGYQAMLAEGGDAAVTVLTAPTASRIDCVVLDLVMPDLDGLGVLARMREQGLDIPVIVQTAHGGIDNVVSVMRAGAADFVVKPASPERLQVSLRNALATKALAGELRRFKRSRDGTLTIADVITRSPAMRPVLHAAEKAAASTIPVLVEGESGTGKELIARAIHGSGARRAKPFVAVNCGALPENLVESILFGHEKGAFTGATEKHTGKFIEADGGTLFLDEVGELPLELQAKLLRVLQEKEVRPVGSNQRIKVDVRVIAATNRDLEAAYKNGTFRKDLYFRLNVVTLYVPALRERRSDTPMLVHWFLERYAPGSELHVTSSAMKALMQYDWPGNVRELENCVERAVALGNGQSIDLSDLPPSIASGSISGGTSASPADRPTVLDPDLAGAHAMSESPRAPLSTTDLEDIERATIQRVFEQVNGDKALAGRMLGISRATLYRKLKRYNIGVGQAGTGPSSHTLQ